MANEAPYRIGIGDEVRYAMNLLPDVTDEAVIKRAKLKRRATRLHPFQFDWKVGDGVNYQYIKLQPGDHPVALRGRDEWRMFELKFADQGGVLVRDPSDEAELRNAREQALTKAREFYASRGEERADDYQIVHGLTDDQMARQRGQIWKWYYNEALVAIIDEELEKLNAWGYDEDSETNDQE